MSSEVVFFSTRVYQGEFGNLKHNIEPTKIGYYYQEFSPLLFQFHLMMFFVNTRYLTSQAKGTLVLQIIIIFFTSIRLGNLNTGSSYKFSYSGSKNEISAT